MRRLVIAAIAITLALLAGTACENKVTEEADEPQPAMEEGEQEQAAAGDQADADAEEMADAEMAEQADTAGDAEAAGVTVAVREHDDLGPYLADAEGRSLYLFEADSEGTSNCYDACAEAWPPLVAPSMEEVTAADRVDETKLDTIERKTGEMQVTYAGMPLYYFQNDQSPGDIEGQDMEGFGGEWYLVSPDGNKVEGPGHRESDDQK